jgi:hypothetical protein
MQIERSAVALVANDMLVCLPEVVSTQSANGLIPRDDVPDCHPAA